MLTDEQLVEQALRGDQAAFGGLVDRYQQPLLRFLRTRCTTPADADDALQEAFLDAWRYLHSFNPRWRFSTWLYRIAIRRAQRGAQELTRAAVDIAVTADPLMHCIDENERDNLWLLARSVLSPDACTALWLHYVDDMPLKEIARAMQRSLPWTKVTLLRARRRLKIALAAVSDGPLEGKAYG